MLPKGRERSQRPSWLGSSQARWPRSRSGSPRTRRSRKYWRGALGSISTSVNPYAAILKNVRKDSSDLTYRNVHPGDMVAPKKPVPATNIFHNDAHRTVTLMASAVEDVDLADGRSASLWDTCLTVLWDTPVDAVVIQDPFSKWTKGDDDIAQYGVPAYGQSHQRLRRDLFRYWRQVHVLFAPVGMHRIQISRLAEDRSIAAEEQMQDELRAAREKEQEEKVERLEDSLTHVRDDSFLFISRISLFGTLRGPSLRASRALSDQPKDMELAYTARVYAKDLRQRHD
ncbi:hypothetical protein ACJZ2D_009108 [Fusarium nematophilum]